MSFVARSTLDTTPSTDHPCGGGWRLHFRVHVHCAYCGERGLSGLKLGFKVETCVVSLEFGIEMIHYYTVISLYYIFRSLIV